MSLWQHKNIHKKHLLWAKLFGICFVFHLIFLFWIFCIYHDNSYLLSISIHKHLDYSTPIMFVPCPMQTPTHTTPKISTTIKEQPPATAKKTSASTTIVQSKPSTPKTLPIEQKKSTTTPEMPKKIPEPPKIEPIKTEPTKQEVKKQEEQKKDIPKIEQPQQKTELLQQKRETTNAHISSNHREVEALRRGAQLQKELVQTWKPPIGVSPECMCEISFFVNTTGIIENLKMIKSSGVIMYDISTRQALCAMKMPQWTYGKPLVISFKQ